MDFKNLLTFWYPCWSCTPLQLHAPQNQVQSAHKGHELDKCWPKWAFTFRIPFQPQYPPVGLSSGSVKTLNEQQCKIQLLHKRQLNLLNAHSKNHGLCSRAQQCAVCLTVFMIIILAVSESSKNSSSSSQSWASIYISSPTPPVCAQHPWSQLFCSFLQLQRLQLQPLEHLQSSPQLQPEPSVAPPNRLGSREVTLPTTPLA